MCSKKRDYLNSYKLTGSLTFECNKNYRDRGNSEMTIIEIALEIRKFSDPVSLYPLTP